MTTGFVADAQGLIEESPEQCELLTVEQLKLLTLPGVRQGENLTTHHRRGSLSR